MLKLSLRILLGIVILLGFASPMLAEGETSVYLVVKMSDGQNRSYLLASKPTVAFDGDIFRVTALELEEELDRNKVSGFYFSDEPVSIESVSNADELSVRYLDGESVLIIGANAEQVQLYTTSGQLLQSVAVDANEVVLSLKGLAQGSYLVKLGINTTIKIIKR